MIKRLLEFASPSGPRARLSVLIFHRVHAQADALFPDQLQAGGFAELCSWLARWFNVLPLDEAAKALREGRLPSRAAALTFDDGYADNHDVALPVLARFGLPCTFFVSTGFLDGGRMWNDTVIEALRRTARERLALDDLLPGVGELPCATLAERRVAIEAVISRVKYLPPVQRQALVDEIARRAEVELPTSLMLTGAQLRAMRAAGMQIGAHTISHPILARLPAGQAQREIVDSKRRLEELLGEPVRLFAYPNGKPGSDYHAETVGLVREAGFAAAFSTAWGAATAESDLMQLPRFTPWERTPRRFALRMLYNMRQRPAQSLQMAVS